MLKKITFLLLFFLTSSLKAQPIDSVLQRYMNEIHKDSIMQHLNVLAADNYLGRGTFEEGGMKALIYLCRQYAYRNLQMLGNFKGERHYVQPFVLQKGNFSDCYFIINGVSYQQTKDFLPCNVFQQGGDVHDLVFAGMGLADSLRNDFKTANATDKWVAIILENKTDDLRKALPSLQAKAKIAKQNGAKGVFFIQRDAENYNMAKQVLQIHEKKYEIVPMRTEKTVDFPILILNEKISAKVFGIKKKALVAFLDSVQQQKVPKRTLKTANIKIIAQPNKETFKTSNVIGALAGTDLKQEAIVVSAHFDHLGTTEDGTIYNGANDNASGTSTMLEMLRILDKMRKDGYKPRRTIIFAAFTAEEKGLWGSRFYTDHPLFPLEKTKFDVNIDMVGVYYWKKKEKPIEFAIVEDENPIFRAQQANLIKNYNLNLKIDYAFSSKTHPDNLFYRSDHYNFAKNGVPIAFFNSMKDKNYHQSTDDIKYIEPDAMQEVAKLIFATIWTEANKN
jgi:hypothetical protein